MVNQEFTTSHRLMVATIVASALQYAWIAFWWAYLRMPEALFCTSDPVPWILPMCPETRPHAVWVIVMIPFIGPFLSVLSAVVLFGFPVADGRTWRRFLLGIPFYSIVVLICLIVTVVAIAIGFTLAT
jgi:hypothetical protein